MSPEAHDGLHHFYSSWVWSATKQAGIKASPVWQVNADALLTKASKPSGIVQFTSIESLVKLVQTARQDACSGNYTLRAALLGNALQSAFWQVTTSRATLSHGMAGTFPYSRQPSGLA